MSNEIDQILQSLFSVDEVLRTPENFFDEVYVQGFLNGYITAVEDIRFDALTWSKDQRGEFRILLYRSINSGDTHGLQRMLKDLNYTRVLANDTEFLTARDEGAAVAVVVHNKLKSGIVEPVIENAKKTAAQADVDLATAMLMNTIGAFKLEWSEKV